MALSWTWGYVDVGSDSSAVRHQLKNVQQIQATSFAFAAILGDGSVVSWGDTDYGGDSSAVTDQAEECAADSSNLLCLCCDPW